MRRALFPRAFHCHHMPMARLGAERKKPAKKISLQAQSVKKVEVQEALPPAGVIGAEPLILVPQHLPRKPA